MKTMPNLLTFVFQFRSAATIQIQWYWVHWLPLTATATYAARTQMITIKFQKLLHTIIFYFHYYRRFMFSHHSHFHTNWIPRYFYCAPLILLLHSFTFLYMLRQSIVSFHMHNHPSLFRQNIYNYSISASPCSDALRPPVTVLSAIHSPSHQEY